MNKPPQAYHRKTYFIKKGFQFEFILKFCLILLLGILISTGLIFVLSQETLTSSFENSKLVIKNTGSAILPTILLTNLITLGIITVAAIIVTLFISHRIAGPLYRFETDLKKIAAGDLRVKIHLRKKDQFFEMAGSINQVTESFHGSISSIHARLDRIESMSEDKKNLTFYKEQVAEIKHMIDKTFSL